MTDISHIEKLAVRIRYLILVSTSKAGSGHPTSSLSATDLMAGLMFGGAYRFDPDHIEHPSNDRLIFSKGHASPLFYALWTVAGRVTETELMTYRQFGSPLEGHPTPAFPYAEAATGSLGQGLSIGVGLAMNAKYVDKAPYRTYVLLGDSEMAEGSQWEAMQIAAHYGLSNLIGILDVNRLGQRGPTMYGHDLSAYDRRIKGFGWETLLVDGHNLPEIVEAFQKADKITDRPVMIIAKTVKGKGVSFLEDRNGWHGKALNQGELSRALKELGEVDHAVQGVFSSPEAFDLPKPPPRKISEPMYVIDKSVPTRKAYGQALKRIFPRYPDMVVLDGEVSNSTYSEIFKEAWPDQFFEMYIAEQNMVGAALGFSIRGKIPFISTFGAFFTRAFDQIRMAQYSRGNIKFCGSHAGVSIGEDGPSQMALEDLAMFRSISGSVVLYPSDAVSTEKLVEAAAEHRGLLYIRTTRSATSILYDSSESFPIGGSKTLRQSPDDAVTIIAAGITLHESLAACDALLEENIHVRLIDLYSIKPLDEQALHTAAKETRAIVTVEDHYPEGGLGEAVKNALYGSTVPIHSLAVRKMPSSGSMTDLLDYEEISRKAIVTLVRKLIRSEA